MTDRRRRPSRRKASVETEQLTEKVLIGFVATGYACMLRDVGIEICGNAIVLSGRLSSYYLKQIAQTAAINVGGGFQVRNEIRVE